MTTTKSLGKNRFSLHFRRRPKDNHEDTHTSHPDVNLGTSEYRPLDLTKREIRLLRIHPTSITKSGDDDVTGVDDINCSVSYACLDGSPVYYALSYVWGSPLDTREIRLGQQSRQVTTNLWKVLYRLRKHSPSDKLFRLWVDAVCIDQDNQEERNYQVAMMGDIYKSAAATWVWLGEGTVRSDWLFDRLSQYGKIHRRMHKSSPEVYISADNGIDDIFSRPYWQRLWILQEIGLAKEIKVMCGDRQLSWEPLDDLVQYALNPPLREIKVGNGAQAKSFLLYDVERRKRASAVAAAVATYQSLKLLRAGGFTSLALLVDKFHQAACSDKRDKIYGIIGMAHLQSIKGLQVDYNLTLLEVLFSFIWHCGRTVPRHECTRIAMQLWYGMQLNVETPTSTPAESPIIMQLGAHLEGKIDSIERIKNGAYHVRMLPHQSNIVDASLWLVLTNTPLERGDICLSVESSLAEPATKFWWPSVMVILKKTERGFNIAGRGSVWPSSFTDQLTHDPQRLVDCLLPSNYITLKAARKPNAPSNSADVENFDFQLGLKRGLLYEWCLSISAHCSPSRDSHELELEELLEK